MLIRPNASDIVRPRGFEKGNAYLSGGMQFAKDLGGAWREECSKELLNISAKDEEKMLESIIYSLTELDNIKKVMIFVGDTYLQNLPHSKKVLPQILTRDYGINKVYDLTTFKDVLSTTTYYSSMDNDSIYFVPITRYINSSSDKVDIIIENLKSTLFVKLI